MSTTSSQGSGQRMRREHSFSVDKSLNDSPYNRRKAMDNGGYTPTLMAKSMRREKTFYRASNFRDSSPGNREKSGATNRSMHVTTDSVRTSNSGGSRISREGSFVKTMLTISDGMPEVPLAESPRIITSGGTFRLDYNEKNSLVYRKISMPEPPPHMMVHCHVKEADGKYPYYNHDDLVLIRELEGPPSIPPQIVRDRENSFINNAISAKNDYYGFGQDPVLRPYDPLKDPHCQSYFKNRAIQRLVAQTRTLKPGEPDLKPQYINQKNHRLY